MRVFFSKNAQHTWYFTTCFLKIIGYQINLIPEKSPENRRNRSDYSETPSYQFFNPFKTTIFLQAENTLDFCFCRLWKCRQHEMETKSSEIAIEVHCCAKRSLWLFTMGGESIWFNQCGFSRKSQENDDVWTFGTTETSLKPPAAMNAILMSCSSLLPNSHHQKIQS